MHIKQVLSQLIYSHIFFTNTMQNSIDNFLVPSLRKTIEQNLGKKTLNKIEKRLVERHGINVTQAIKDFHKFDSVLREFFGSGADGLEIKFLQNIINIERSLNNNIDWLTIQDQELAKVFLESIGDVDKNAIMNSVLDKPLIVADILESCKIPQTSGYRKINSLIKCGLLIPNGYTFTKDQKKVTKYESLFQNIEIGMGKNRVKVKIQPKEHSVENSTILQTIRV